MRLLGIDPSPNGTATVSLYDSSVVDFNFVTDSVGIAKKFSEFAVLIPKVKFYDESARMERLNVQYKMIDAVVFGGLSGHSYIALEDYVFGASGKSGGIYQIGELGGLIRWYLWKKGAIVRTYHPVSVKLAWVGKGNADKAEMVQRAHEYIEEHGDRSIFTVFKRLSKRYQEGISDALAVAYLLKFELSFRAGEIQLSEMSESMVRVFNRVTKSVPLCLIDRPFMGR